MKTVFCRPREQNHQTGQAALEALICLLAMGVLWTGITWLGRIQDLALHANHAARFSAFMATRNDTETTVAAVRTGVFRGSGNQWSDHRGAALQDSVYQNINVHVAYGDDMPAGKRIGGADPRIRQLRDDWLNAESGVLSAQVSLVPRGVSPDHVHEHSLLKLHQFDAAYPLIRRHTSILTGAGHASGDLSAADRITNSTLAWSGPTSQSYRLGRRVASVASNVDSGWRRPQPVFDWLHPWAGDVPSHHLRSIP